MQLLKNEEMFFVALCPELDIPSQGDTIEDANKNLKEAVELFFKCAGESELSARYL